MSVDERLSLSLFVVRASISHVTGDRNPELISAVCRPNCPRVPRALVSQISVALAAVMLWADTRAHTYTYYETSIKTYTYARMGLQHTYTPIPRDRSRRA